MNKKKLKIKFKRVLCLLLICMIAFYTRIIYSWYEDNNKNKQTTQSSTEYQPFKRQRFQDTSSLEQQSSSSSSSSSSFSIMSLKRRIIYVHIGKTGGESIKAQLQVICNTRKNPKVKQDCLQSFNQSTIITTSQSSSSSYLIKNSIISTFTVGYIHINTMYPRNAIPLGTTFLFTLRDPIERIKSWYRYNHPKSCFRILDSPSCQMKSRTSGWGHDFYTKCFDTFQSFVMANTLSIFCQNVANQGWNGLAPSKEANHLQWNHEHYYNLTVKVAPRKEIMVIRTEHLWQDFNNLEQFLGASKISTSPRSSQIIHYAQPKETIDTSLTEHAMATLCCKIQKEIHIYLELLDRAVNLQDADKQSTKLQLLSKCNVSHFEDLCQ